MLSSRVGQWFHHFVDSGVAIVVVGERRYQLSTTREEDSYFHLHNITGGCGIEASVVLLEVKRELLCFLQRQFQNGQQLNG